MSKPQIIRICRYCGKKFERHFRLQHYCDLKCRLMANVVAPSPDSCWEWNAAKHKSGYGEFRWNDNFYRAHRVSYEVHKGEIPQKKHVCHTCDNPPCVNPSHLFLGSDKDNLLDMAKKGRHGGTVLNPDKVRVIRDMLRLGVPVSRISSAFNVSNCAITCVRDGVTWCHVK